MNTSVVVMTCDSYEDTWGAFFQLKDKYWSNCPYETYIVTEEKACNYAVSLKKTGAWTKRLREALEDIKTKYIIFMLDDFFIRQEVDQKGIEYAERQFQDDIATLSFMNVISHNKDYCDDTDEINGYIRRKNNMRYLANCQPSIWDRKKMIEILQKDQDPWQWELTPINSKYRFYVIKDKRLIDNGYYDYKSFGINKGQWTKEAIEFLKSEGIEIDGTRGKH